MTKQLQIKALLVQMAADGKFDQFDMNTLDESIFDEIVKEEPSMAGWYKEDILRIAEDEDIDLTDEQAAGVIDYMIKEGDTSDGIGDNDLEDYIERYFAEFGRLNKKTA